MGFFLRRPRLTRVLLNLTPVIAVLVGLLVGCLFLLVANIDPVSGFRVMLEGAVGDSSAISDTLTQATPILFAALAVTVCFRAGVFSVGQEGAIYIGALAGIPVGIYVHLPGPLLIAAAFVASALAGAAWSLIPAWAKVKRGTNEIMSTLLLNFVAINLVAYFVARRYGPLWNDQQSNAASNYVQRAAHLPTLISGTDTNSAFVLAVAIALVLMIVMSRSTAGFQIRALGLNRGAARYAGHSINRTIVYTMLASGAIAGLAGTAAILSQTYLLTGEVSPPPGWGYIGIAAALLGSLRPGFVVLAALLFGGLKAGGDALQLSVDAPASLSDVIQGIIIIIVMASAAGRAAFARRYAVGQALRGAEGADVDLEAGTPLPTSGHEVHSHVVHDR